jgi:transcription-repair coupling factor (superfamily II helicase)
VLLNSDDQELTFDNLIEFLKQSALEKVEECEEPQPEPKEKTMTVSNLIDGFGLIEAGIKVLEETDLSEQRAATTRQKFKRFLSFI